MRIVLSGAGLTLEEVGAVALGGARIEIAGLLGASPNELVMVRGTTEAINLVAHSLELGKDDEVERLLADIKTKKGVA